MAKQRGIYQLKGKLNGYSYYRMVGVESGLVRRINETMSERVKTSPEYANTRATSTEFRVAAKVAAAIAQGIDPSWRPTKSLFKASRLTAGLFEVLKLGSGDWGTRMFTDDLRDNMCDAINKFTKRKVSDFGRLIIDTYTSVTSMQAASFQVSADNAAILSAMRADGFDVRVYQLQVNEAASMIDPELVGTTSYVINQIALSDFNIEDTPEGTTLQFSFESLENGEPSPDGSLTISFYVVTITPYKVQPSGAVSILQSECAFEFIPDPQHPAPEE